MAQKSCERLSRAPPRGRVPARPRRAHWHPPSPAPAGWRRSWWRAPEKTPPGCTQGAWASESDDIAMCIMYYTLIIKFNIYGWELTLVDNIPAPKIYCLIFPNSQIFLANLPSPKMFWVHSPISPQNILDPFSHLLKVF